jgi:hypothetical protein
MPLSARHRLFATLLAGAIVAPLAGCLERRLYITSEPTGALVRLNDVEVGRTPVEVDFEWYGTYDVRLELEGHEPLATSAKADAPVHEWPGIDFVTMALPMKFKNDVRWHFELEPESFDEAEAIARGREVRTMLPALPPPPADPEPAPETPDDDGAPTLEPEPLPLEAPPAPEPAQDAEPAPSR